jgi:hypothetical protein
MCVGRRREKLMDMGVGMGVGMSMDNKGRGLERLIAGLDK